MKILITGGAGFIGSTIAEKLHDECEVVIYDNLKSGKMSNINFKNIKFVNASILDREALSDNLKGVDYVFNLAALLNVTESDEKRIDYINVNEIGTSVLLEECKKAGVKKLCFSSSSAVYGDSEFLPQNENTECNPKSLYGLNKLNAELYCNKSNLKTVCLRYFNVFGPRQNLDTDYAAVIPFFIKKALNNEDITIYGDGEQTRDFIFVEDIANANIFACIENEEMEGIFNVCTNNSISINVLTETIIKLTNSKSNIIYLKERNGEVKHSFGSNKKILEKGFVIKNSFISGLEKTIANYKKFNGMIFTLSSRTKCLKISLKSLFEKYNYKYNYPVYVYYFDDIYSKEYISNVHDTINKNIHFHHINYGIPKHINNNDLFMYKKNDYARSFGMERIGYLHMINFFFNAYNYPGTHLKNYDYCFHFDDETLFMKEIPYDIFSKLYEEDLLAGSLNCMFWPEKGAPKNHKETTEYLFEFCNKYIEKYKIKRNTKQFNAFKNKSLFYSNNIKLTDSQVFNMKLFETKEWLQWTKEVNDYGGIYKHRWGDHQLFAMFYAIHFDEEIFDYKLTKNKEYIDCGGLKYIQNYAPNVKFIK